MYTNRGMLAMMTTANIVANYAIVQKHLAAAERGEEEINAALYADLVRWEQDMHAHIVGMAEHVGRTNVCNSSMRL
jgi:hypothetical protein